MGGVDAPGLWRRLVACLRCGWWLRLVRPVDRRWCSSACCDTSSTLRPVRRAPHGQPPCAVPGIEDESQDSPEFDAASWGWCRTGEECRVGAPPRLLANHLALTCSARLPRMGADNCLSCAVEGGRGRAEPEKTRHAHRKTARLQAPACTESLEDVVVTPQVRPSRAACLVQIEGGPFKQFVAS